MDPMASFRYIQLAIVRNPIGFVVAIIVITMLAYKEKESG